MRWKMRTKIECLKGNSGDKWVDGHEGVFRK